MSDEVFVSVDCETTGRIPGPYSMISLGAIAYDQSGRELTKFKVNLEELPGASRDAETMRWWKKHPKAWQAATRDPVIPKDAMRRLDWWLGNMRGTPKLIGWPLMYDFMFITWYWEKLLAKIPPFGYDGIDIKSYAMRATRSDTLRELSRSKLIKHFGFTDSLTHDPIDDARTQALLFFFLRNSNGL